MAYTEILTDNGLTQEEWDDQIFEEYVGPNWWKFLMDTETNRSDAAITIKFNLMKGDGDAMTFGLASRVVGGRVKGNNKGIGNEGRMDFYNQRITINNDRILVKIEDVPMTNKRVGFDVLQKAKNGLVVEAGVNLEEDITTALSDVTTGRVRGRYLYGATDANWNATHLTAQNNMNNDNDKMTAKMIRIAKRKAVIPKVAEAKIRPVRFKNGKNFEQWYVLVMHPYAFRDLSESDPAWRNKELLLPPGGDRTGQMFTGSSFKGALDGVLIYEYDRVLLDTAPTIQQAHNLLIGAQAGMIGWGQTSKFGEEAKDVGHDMVFEVHEIRGISKAVFNRTTPEDHGIVNVFSAALDD